jgi:hypothetical protein
MSDVFTTEEVAAWWKVTTQSIRKYIRTGALHVEKRPGLPYRIPLDAVRSWSGLPDVSASDIEQAFLSKVARDSK